MDSYQKYANDVLGDIEKPIGIFKYVKAEDLDEVWVRFSVLVSHLLYADNYRIFPLHMEKQFKEIAVKGCCGSVNTQYKCLSGNVYWVGCNYGH